MDPKHLYYLSVILDKGSMTDAAQSLAVTQPTLTRVVATLEMQVGTKIFHRSRHGVKPTPLGEALAREGRAIQRNVDAAIQYASRYKIGLDKEIRVGVGPIISSTFFPEVLVDLLKQYPQASLTVTTSSPVALYQGLMEDRFDLIIGPSAEPKVPAGFHREVIKEDHLGIFCSPEHPYASLKTIDASRIREASWLSIGHASPFEREIMTMLGSSGVNRIRTQAVFINNLFPLLETLMLGRHLSVLPQAPLAWVRDRYPLVQLKLTHEFTTHRDIYLCCKDALTDNPVYASLRESLLRALSRSDHSG